MIKAKILYVQSNRSHKIIPLLTDHPFQIVKKIKDAFRVWKFFERPTGVIIDSFGFNGILGYMLSVLTSSPLVVRLRGDVFEEAKERRDSHYRHFPWLRYTLSLYLTAFILNRSKGIVFNSDYLYRKVQPCIHGNKIKGIVYNPFTPLNNSDDARVSFDPEGFLLISATNMNLKAKVMYQLERMLEIPNSKWESLNLYWYICGDGVFRTFAEKIIHDRGLAGRIILTGRISNIEAYFTSCHVCIHLSTMDAFPNTTLEAMYYGLPVITNDESCGTLEQVFHGRNGVVLKKEDMVADAVEMYRNNPEIRLEHGRNGRIVVNEKFSVKTQKAQMNSFLQKLASTPH